MALSTVWAFVEESRGRSGNAGARVAHQGGATRRSSGAIYLGTGSDDAFATLGAYGARQVFQLDPEVMPASAPAAAAVAALVEHGLATCSSLVGPTPTGTSCGALCQVGQIAGLERGGCL